MALIACPACGSEVSSSAPTCPRCGQPIAGPPVQLVVVDPRKWNKGIAALLSFIWPGAGQLYKGEVLGGLLWFAVVGGMYVLGAFLCLPLIPAVILHVICIFMAASGDETR